MERKTLFWPTIWLVAAAVAWLCCSTCSLGAEYRGLVVKVIDGDTIDVEVPDDAEGPLRSWSKLRVRLAHIDAPEKAQPYGKEAAQFVKDLTLGKKVIVEPQGKPDRYGRTVAEVWVTEADSLNEFIVGYGYAWHYKAYSKDQRFSKLEGEARKARAGLWAGKSPESPWDYRARKKREAQKKKARPTRGRSPAAHTAGNLTGWSSKSTPITNDTRTGRSVRLRESKC